MVCVRRFVILYAAAVGLSVAKQDMETYKMPVHSDEELESETLPDELKCDACTGIVYHLKSALDKIKPKDTKQLLKSGDKQAVREQAALIAERLEEACQHETYADYGLKFMDSGEKRLHGPGNDVDGPGKIAGGAKWPFRLAHRCGEILGEKEEDGLVDLWREGGLSSICDQDCGKVKKQPARKAKKQKATQPKTSSPTPKKAKAPLTGLEDMPAPPYVSQDMTGQQFADLLDGKKKKRPKFIAVMFYDASSRCAAANAMLEMAARRLEKEKSADMRKMKNAIIRYNSTDGDTFGFNFKGEALPKMLLYRKGYKNAKAYDGGWEGPDDILAWLRNEVVNVYMTDDPERYPRAEL